MRRLTMAIVCGLAMTAPVSAAELTGTLKKVKETKTIVLGHRDASRPFSFAGEDGKPAGYSVDLCLRIAAAVQKELALPDLRVKWVKVTPESRVKAVVDGTIDLECGSTTASLSRQEQVDFTNLTFVDGGSLLVTDASRINGVKDLGGKRVAVIPGTTTDTALAEALRKYMISATRVAVKDHAEGVAALDNGLADAYASDRVILIALGRRSKDPSKLSIPLQLFSSEPYGFMLRRGDAAFRLVANRELARLYRSDDIVHMYEKWFGDLGTASLALQLMYTMMALPE